MMKTRVSLNLPRSLKAAAEDWARQEGVSLNQFIACALAEKVGAKNAPRDGWMPGRNNARMHPSAPICTALRWGVLLKRSAYSHVFLIRLGPA